MIYLIILFLQRMQKHLYVLVAIEKNAILGLT